MSNFELWGFSLVLQLLVPGSGYVSDCQMRLERCRQQDRNKRARVTPDERNKKESQPHLVCVALLSCLSIVKECDLAAVQSAGHCTVCHFTHTRPIMLRISLANLYITSL